MACFTTRIMPVFKSRRSVLRVHERLWSDLLTQLRNRGEGYRESGAFYFGRRDRPGVVSEFVLYDELDPDCLNGGIDFHGIGYHRLSEHCRQRDVQVLGDVHTHPSSWVGQSRIDSSHPMVSRKGHLALIVPNFAQGEITARNVGLHRYREDQAWDSWHGRAASRRLYIGRRP
jgi:hypothetical protein